MRNTPNVTQEKILVNAVLRELQYLHKSKSRYEEKCQNLMKVLKRTDYFGWVTTENLIKKEI